jgi:type I restriction enzyme M protein
MVLRQKRDRDDVLFIDASKGFIKSGKKNKLRASDIRRIVDTYESRQNADKYARRVSREEIRANGYNLNIPRYVDSSDAAETWDLYATMYGAIPNREIDALPYWSFLPTLRQSLFQPISNTHSTPRKDDEIRYLINADRSYCNLRDDYTRTMDGIDAFLHQQLLSSINTVPVNREEDIISDELFARLGKHPIFNPYDVYQLLDDSWQVIATDLEILQTEGWDKVREVEPNMVLKKKKDKDSGVETEIEVQEGWRGRIMPFDLVQILFLSDMLHQRANLQAEVEGCANEIDDKIRELADENREKYIDAESEKLDTKQLAADVKAMQKDPDLKDPELMELQRLLNKQKEINKELKALEAALIDKTCYTIEHLSDDDAYTLLREKWIMPLCAKIHSLPTELLNTIETDVNRLIKRYADTLLNVGNEIEKAESELANLLGELTGDEADMQAIRELQKLLQ